MRGIITVVGLDRVGIISGVCTKLAEYNINILDINQSILNDFFNMIMIVDMENMTGSFEDITNDLHTIGVKLNVDIKLQHEAIFKSMHRI